GHRLRSARRGSRGLHRHRGLRDRHPRPVRHRHEHLRLNARPENMTTTAIDYLVCPFTPDLLERFRAQQPSADAKESTPIRFPDPFRAGMTVAAYVGLMDECSIGTSLVASVKFGSIMDPHQRLSFD